MTIAILCVFFPVDGVALSTPHVPGLDLLHGIVRDARTLRAAVADYRHHLDLQADRQTSLPF